VRADERQVDGDELEQERQREKSPLEEKRTDDLAGIGGDELRSVGHQRHDALLDVMRSILDDETINLHQLGLPQREVRALEAMQVAVTGKSADKHQFVYAEDRRTMLEQALAVLQPDLISHEAEVVSELQEQLTALTDKVTELRDQLLNLEDGQDDVLGMVPEEKKAEDADSDDEPEDADADKKDSTLYGPERKEAKKPATTLTGPEVKHEKQPTTLTGPEVKHEKQATTLGDAKEIAAAAKKTWWQR
jgi:hypothetical protein